MAEREPMSIVGDRSGSRACVPAGDIGRSTAVGLGLQARRRCTGGSRLARAAPRYECTQVQVQFRAHDRRMKTQYVEYRCTLLVLAFVYLSFFRNTRITYEIHICLRCSVSSGACRKRAD